MSADIALLDQIDRLVLFPAHGWVTRVASGHIEADGPLSALGDLCEVEASGHQSCVAEVSAVSADHITLIPLESTTSIKPGHRVSALADGMRMPVGDAFAGRVIDGLGRPIDQGPSIASVRGSQELSVCALDRVSPSQMLETGIRAIDGLLPIGVGQRIGIFAASGVGKTHLVNQLARQIACDHIIICQVGERGREVESLWSTMVAGKTGCKITIVAATSDEAAPMRVRAVEQALVLAEHWRSLGRHVLLLVDSVTRLAMALREIGLASGEPPTVRAYTPNVLRALPQLVERCGALRSGGAITAIFTVLSETDEVDDPIVEVMTSLLDGHILLSRALAQLGHFPAINISKSISRLASTLATPDHHRAATRVLALHARYEASRILIESGLYTAGSEPQIDEAIAAQPAITAFLRQAADDRRPWPETRTELASLAGTEAGHD